LNSVAAATHHGQHHIRVTDVRPQVLATTPISALAVVGIGHDFDVGIGGQPSNMRFRTVRGS